MTAQNEQQNLINDLKAPIKSFRIFALEEAIRSGSSPEVLAVLEEISRSEDDGECQMLVSHAIAAVKDRLAGAQVSVGASIKEHEEFVVVWEKANEHERMRMLSDLPVRLPKDLREMGPELIAGEKSPVIAAKIVRVFCRTWPEEKFSQLTALLDSNSLSLKLAALRTIVHMKPELLIDDLPALLNAKDPQIKALAIRGLAKIDKEEALNHLQALLLSPELSDRLAGIQNCPFLPFEMVKPVLLKYFAAENHAELLIRAGWILEMNPDVQVPFKLFEIAERSPAKKAELVKGVLNEAVKLLEKSGILGNQFAAFTRKLQTWVNKKNALRFVKQVAAKLNSEKVDPELEQTIRNSLKQATVVEAFSEALGWPVSETVKGRIGAYLKSVTANKPSAQSIVEEAKESETFPAKVEEVQNKVAEKTAAILIGKTCAAQIEFFAGLENPEFSKAQGQAVALFSGKDTSVEVKIAALHAFSRLKQKGLEAEALRLINNSNVALATAAVEYLGEIDPEAIFPFLGQCLKVPDVRMKSAALGILKNFDFNQAVSSLNAMLRSYDPDQQRMAIECMDQFDFALIRDQLTEYLCRCDTEALVEAGLCHFAANSSTENLYSLYKIEKAHSGTIAAQIAQLREKCRGLSEAGGIIIEADKPVGTNHEAELQQRWQEEQEKKKSRRPAYAYRDQSAEEKPTSREQLVAIGNALREWVNTRGPLIGGALIVVLALIFYVFFMPGEADKTLQNLGGAIISQTITVEGTVDSVDQLGAVVFTSKDAEKFVLTPQNDGFRLPKSGDKLRISILPYRKTADNMYLVRLISIREIEGYGQE